VNEITDERYCWQCGCEITSGDNRCCSECCENDGGDDENSI
jgi:hypothetical protein